MHIDNIAKDYPTLKDVVDVIKERDKVKKLYPPQTKAVKTGFLNNKNLLLATPTSSGKTLLAELAALKKIKEQKKVVYLVPLKSLAVEKYHDFKEKYSSLGVRIGMAIGDLDSREYWLKDFDFIICSYEKFDSLLRHNPLWIGEVGLVVVDEIHMLDSIDRGATLEVLVTRLKKDLNPQILALSATVSNAKEVGRWLDAEVVESDFRPIKLYKGLAYKDENDINRIEFIDAKKNFFLEGPLTISLAEDVVKKGKQAFVFVSTRRAAEACAEKIGKRIEKLLSKNEKKSLVDLSEKILHALQRPTRQCKRLAAVVKKGIGFDHAGLTNKQKTLIENAFRDGIVKIITCTPVLSYGVSLPAYRVIIRDTKRYSGAFGSHYIPVFDYFQMSGRAGRVGWEKEGESMLLAKTASEAEHLKNKYILAKPEPIYSKLAVEPMLRMQTLALIATYVTRSRDELREFFSQTFFAVQYGDIEEIEQKLVRILEQLRSFGFITTGKKSFISEEFVPAFEMDDTLSPTRLGKRVAELYLDPISADFIIKNLKNQKDIGYLQVINQCGEMRPLLRVRKNEQEYLEEEMVSELEDVPDVWDLDYDDYLRAYKTSRMFMSWMDEMTEDEIFDKYGVTPGELHNKLNNADWMLYSAIELAKLLGKKGIANKINRVRLRLRHGVKEELLPLVKIKGIGRVRARKLWNKGIKKPKDVRKYIKKVKVILGEKIGEKTLKNIDKSSNI
jgi:helicase